MKNKSLKRTVFNKIDSEQIRRHSASSTTNRERAMEQSQLVANEIRYFQTGHGCFKENLTLRPEKLLKRDLLRCDDFRRCYLIPPRRPATKLARTFCDSSSVDRLSTRVSLSITESSVPTDHFGPWPEYSVRCVHPNGKDFLRRLKNTRGSSSSKELQDSSPKLQFYSSINTSIDDYRKQKGYFLDNLFKSPSSTTSLTESDERLLSTTTIVDRPKLQLTNTDIILCQNKFIKLNTDAGEHSNTIPSIPSNIRPNQDSHHHSHLPLITMRNGHLRQTRQTFQQSIVNQQSLVLPSLSGSSIPYLNSPDKTLVNPNKTNLNGPSKLYFIQGRQKKR